MALDESSQRRMFALTPPGPPVSPSVAHLLAEAGSCPVGALVDGTVRTWLAQPDGRLVLMMWPREPWL
jgi:hypothetical protein